VKAQIYLSRHSLWQRILQGGAIVALLLVQAVLSMARASLLDASFNPETDANAFITAMARQTDGRIVIAEAIPASDSDPRSTRISRLQPDGSLDPSFNPGTGPDDDINALVIQPDGRIVIAGYFNRFDGITRSGIARLNADGSLDNSFDPGTGVEIVSVHPQAHTVALQADGKIVIGGFFRNVNGVARDGIAQLNTNGSVDLSFDPGAGLHGYVALALAVMTNGQVLVGGIFDKVNGVPRKSIARLNANGSVDESFSVPDGGVGGSNALERVFALAVQPDGQVLIGGDFTIVAGARRQHVARLNARGSLDRSFDPGFIYLQRVVAVALQPDGRLIIGGEFTAIDGVSRNCIARLQSDGSLDLGFDPGTGAQVPLYSHSAAFVSSLALEPDGRIILAGLFDTLDSVSRRNIARLHPGSDTNLVILNFAPFPINHAVAEDAGTAIVTINRIGVSDRVVTVDYATRDDTAKAGADYSARSGTVTFDVGERTKTISIPILEDTLVENDETFRVVLANPSADAVIGSEGTLNVTIEEDDSGVEFSAATYTVNELERTVQIKVTRVGRLGDAGVGPGRSSGEFTVDFATRNGTATAGQDYLPLSGTLRFGPLVGPWARSLTVNVPILDDVLVEGSETFFVSLSNPSDGIVLGEKSTATVMILDNDTPSGPGRGANDAIQAILSLSDGKAILGGDFTFVDGVARNRVARVNANATLDPSFEPGTGADAPVFALALQKDGKVLVGGAFKNLNGVPRNGIARLHRDGSVDPAFDPGIGLQGSSHGIEATLKSIVVQTNGQILIGGFFSECGGLARSGIARLNADGSLDPGFNPSYGQDAVFPMAVQADGKILAGGYFKVSGLVLEFARLSPDGSLDEDFKLGANALSLAHVTGLALQDDGKILALGRFVGTNRDMNGVLRFNRDGSVDDSYGPANGLVGHANSFILQGDNRLLIGGYSAPFSFVNPGGVTRLTPDGALDPTFHTQLGQEENFLADVFSVATQPAGPILVGGNFHTVNGVSRYRLAQLNPDGSVLGSVILDPPVPLAGGHVRLSTQNAAGMELVVEASPNLVNWVPIYTNTTPDSRLEFIDTHTAEFRQRFYRAFTRP